MRGHVTVLVLMVLASGICSGDEPRYIANEQDELRRTLEQYTTCNKECSLELAKCIFNSSADVTLVALGVSEVKDKKAKILSVYAFLRLLNEQGQKIVDSHGACSNKCDAMHNAIVELGRKGMLGPILRGEFKESWFERDDYLQLWLKYVTPPNPGSLPAHFHDDIRWDMISRTS